jgi:hypothetical protein
MYGVIIEVKVDPSREEEARAMLRDMIVPQARAHRGFTAGHWLRSLQADMLTSVQLFDTEADALAKAEQIRSAGPPRGAPVTLKAIDTYEVIAQV